MQCVGQTTGETVEPCLGRAVHVVGPTYPGTGDRREHHQRSPAGLPHRRGQMGEQADLRDVVGVHDGDGVRGVALGATLVAEDAERQHRGVDRAVLGNDRIDQRAVRFQVVGVEFDANHPRRSGRADAAICRRAGRRCGPPIRSTARGESDREFDADFAAAAENQHCRCARVIHGCDYVLR